jgi:hypothetical protein
MDAKAWRKRLGAISCRGRSSSIEWVPPTKPGKTSETSVGRDPLVPGLDCEGGVVGVGDKVSLGTAFAAQVDENTPVPLPRYDGHGIGPYLYRLTKSQGIVDAARGIEHFRVGHNSQEA